MQARGLQGSLSNSITMSGQMAEKCSVYTHVCLSSAADMQTKSPPCSLLDRATRLGCFCGVWGRGKAQAPVGGSRLYLEALLNFGVHMRVVPCSIQLRQQLHPPTVPGKPRISPTTIYRTLGTGRIGNRPKRSGAFRGGRCCWCYSCCVFAETDGACGAVPTAIPPTHACTQSTTPYGVSCCCSFGPASLVTWRFRLPSKVFFPTPKPNNSWA